MSLHDIVKACIDEIISEINKEDNMKLLKEDIINPIIKDIMDGFYPYIIKIII